MRGPGSGERPAGGRPAGHAALGRVLLLLLQRATSRQQDRRTGGDPGGFCQGPWPNVPHKQGVKPGVRAGGLSTARPDGAPTALTTSSSRCAHSHLASHPGEARSAHLSRACRTHTQPPQCPCSSLGPDRPHSTAQHSTGDHGLPATPGADPCSGWDAAEGEAAGAEPRWRDGGMRWRCPPRAGPPPIPRRPRL